MISSLDIVIVDLGEEGFSGMLERYEIMLLPWIIVRIEAVEGFDLLHDLELNLLGKNLYAVRRDHEPAIERFPECVIQLTNAHRTRFTGTSFWHFYLRHVTGAPPWRTGK